MSLQQYSVKNSLCNNTFLQTCGLHHEIFFVITHFYCFYLFFIYILANKEEEEEEEEASGFEGTPKPMLPYSSMFIFGPTNPYVN